MLRWRHCSFAGHGLGSGIEVCCAAFPRLLSGWMRGGGLIAVHDWS